MHSFHQFVGFVLFPIRGAETSAQSRRRREVTMSWVADSIVDGNWRNVTWHEVFNLAELATPLTVPRVRVDLVLAA